MTKLWKVAVCVAVGVLVAASPAAAALGVNLDVLWRPNPDDDLQVGLHVTNLAYPQPRENLVECFHQIQNPYEDYPILAFIAFHAHVTPEVVWSYKKKGHKWSAVMMHFGVRPNVLFVDLPAAPRPPYGHAYGNWRKHGNRLQPDQISNDDIRFWVGLHTLSRYTGMRPAEVYDWHKSGRKYSQVAGARFREKQGKGPKVNQAGFDSPGRGNGKGQGKGNGKQKDRD